MTEMSIGSLAAVAAFGTLEGYVFFKSGLLSPAALRDQMQFKSMIVMKLFISGVGSSMVTQAIMSKIWPKDFEESRQMSKTNVGYARAMGGCAILGVGMAICGAGPTMIPGTLAAKSGGSLYTFLGALVGAALWAIVEKPFFSLDIRRKPGQITTLDHKLGVSYASIAMPAGLAMLGATAALEYAWPHKGDMTRTGMNLAAPMLPILAGVAIGFNQLPLRLLSGKGQGGATSVMNIVSTVTAGKLAPAFKLNSLGSASQLVYLYIGTVVGAYFAMTQEPSYTPHPGFGDTMAFIGGAVMLFGARMAYGCTCGHGISGMSELAMQSIAGGMSIFGAGILTGFFF